MSTAKQLLNRIERNQKAQTKHDYFSAEFVALEKKEDVLIGELEIVTGIKDATNPDAVNSYFQSNGLEKYIELAFLLGDGSWS